MNKLLTITTLAAALAAVFPADAADYQLKNRSQFTPADATQNPFWPIGWVKPAPGQAKRTAPMIAVRPEDFYVSSISIMDGVRFAVVNGKVYGEGEKVPAIVNNQRIAVQIVAIQDGGVTLHYDGQALNITLKRKEDQALNQTAPPEAVAVAP